MADADAPVKHESRAILELHDRGAKIILLNPDKSPARGFVAATREDVQNHHGDFGIFPISLGLICIDIDEGHAKPILDIGDSMGLKFHLHPTGRGVHGWIRGRVSDDFAYYPFEHDGIKGEIRLGGGPGQGAYCKVWCAHTLLAVLEEAPANTDTLTDFVMLLRGMKRQNSSSLSTNTIKERKRLLTPLIPPSLAPRTARGPGPAHLKMAGYFVGNRNNKLNSDVWHLTMMDKSIEVAIAFARESGLEDDEIARTVKSAVSAAHKHWYWRLMNGQLDTDGLTNRQGDTVLRVLQSIARGADWRTGEGCRRSQKTIAKDARCSVPTVKNAIRKLLKLGLIRQTGIHVVSRKRYKSGRVWTNQVNIYAIDLLRISARMVA